MSALPAQAGPSASPAAAARGPFRQPADLLTAPGIGAQRSATPRGLIRTAEAP